MSEAFLVDVSIEFGVLNWLINWESIASALLDNQHSAQH